MAIYFTSDLHFRHANILQFEPESREFNSIEEHDEYLIETWNEFVNPEDTIYHLGDFCLAGVSRWIEILERLNGKIHMVKGNHDRDKIAKRVLREGLIEEYYPIGHYMKAGGYILHLTHYPLDIGIRPKMLSISGHIHSHKNKMINQLNVGVDSPIDYGLTKFGQPVHIDQLIAKMDEINPALEELRAEQRAGTTWHKTDIRY